MVPLLVISGSSLSQINLFPLLSRAITPGDQKHATGILISANHLTVTHDDRSCGQGGEMWFEQKGVGEHL